MLLFYTLHTLSRPQCFIELHYHYSSFFCIKKHLEKPTPEKNSSLLVNERSCKIAIINSYSVSQGLPNGGCDWLALFCVGNLKPWYCINRISYKWLLCVFMTWCKYSSDFRRIRKYFKLSPANRVYINFQILLNSPIPMFAPGYVIKRAPFYICSVNWLSIY